MMNYSEYHPFGMQMPGRHGSDNSEGEYRYGFNGMEKDDEVKGISGTSYNFGARMYDSRVGRFLSKDPKAKLYPNFSPYCYADNNPIYFIDENGEGPMPVTNLPTPSLFSDLLSSGVIRQELSGLLWHRKDNYFESNPSSLDKKHSEYISYSQGKTSGGFIETITRQEVVQNYDVEMSAYGVRITRTSEVTTTTIKINSGQEQVLSVEKSSKKYTETIYFSQVNGICSDQYPLNIIATHPEFSADNTSSSDVSNEESFSTGDKEFDNKIIDAFKENERLMNYYLDKIREGPEECETTRDCIREYNFQKVSE